MFYNLPENVQYQVYKLIYTETIVPCFKHKDWWWHTVECRSNKGIFKMDNPRFLDAENYEYSTKKDFFIV